MFKRILKWFFSIVLLAVIALAIFLINLIWFRPWSLNLFDEKVFAEVIFSEPELLSQLGLVEQFGITSHNGNALSLELEQPIPVWEAAVHAKFAAATAGYFNPFGTTVTPGARRGELFVDFKPFSSSTVRLGMVDERNHTDVVDNSRVTVSARWEQAMNDRLRLRLGFDHRHYNDAIADRTTDSNLVTASADMKVTEKLQVAAKREQNLGDADPTYPDQTTLSATYQVSKWAKMFVTERLASAAITPIADLSPGGFTGTSARQETAFGMETRLNKFTSMISRYQIENGIDGTDSFAIIGLQNRLPLTKQLSLELGLEHSFHLAGSGDSYDSATVGFGWAPTKDFRASARYEFRDRSGLGELLAFGAAGRIASGITALSRIQMAKSDFQGRSASSLTGMAALAIRPLDSDRIGVLFSYDHRSSTMDGLNNLGLTRQRLDSLSTDGYIQVTNRLELLGHAAIRLTADGQPDLPFVSTLSYLTQFRAQYRLTNRLDWAGEMRMLIQPDSGTRRSSYGAELGFWVIPDLRLGAGYNFNTSTDPGSALLPQSKRGFYFTISSKLSSRFDLFGNRNEVLSGTAPDEKEKGDAKP